MKKTQIATWIALLMILITVTGCSTKDDTNQPTVKEPEGTIKVIDDKDQDTEEPEVKVIKIDRYEAMVISDWLDENTVLVSKENELLDKMKLAELEDSYPRSLYLLNLTSKEFDLLKAQEQLNLEGAVFSPDKKNLLYSGNTLGDPGYYVMNVSTQDSYVIKDGETGVVGSANWADADTIIGAGYFGGGYTADTKGKATRLEGLEEKSVFIIRKMKDIIYYNTGDDISLKAYHLSTKKSEDLDLTSVVGVYPSQNGDQMLVLQNNGTKMTLLLCNADGSIVKTIAEGSELGGISWSQDQKMAAFSMNSEGATPAGALYLYDMVTGNQTQLAVDVKNAMTQFSPSGKELAYAEWDGKQYNSSIIYLDYSEIK